MDVPRLSLQYLLKPNASRVFDGTVEELELSDDGNRVQQVRVKSGDVRDVASKSFAHQHSVLFNRTPC